jgi:hypothetical protein
VNFDEYKDSLDGEKRDVLMAISAIERDESITPMERSVKICELEARRCSIEAARCAVVGDQDGELSFSRQKADWHARLKVAVAARSQDLLPKILDRQSKDEDIVRELYAIK